MNNQDYWLDRAIKKDANLEKDIQKIAKKLKKTYKEVIKELKKELSYLKETNQLTSLQQYRIDETIKSIERILDEMATNEEQQLTKTLTEQYKKSYEYEQISLGTSFDTINDNLIKEVIQTNWSGLTFSERIWNSRDKLAIKLKEVLNKGLIRGDSLQTMARLLADELNKDYNRALTLVHTETCWVQNQATLKAYKDADLEEYEYMAFLDNRTTKECRELDGKIFKLSEAIPGVNAPPTHPRCRSCIVPVIE